MVSTSVYCYFSPNQYIYSCLLPFGGCLLHCKLWGCPFMIVYVSSLVTNCTTNKLILPYSVLVCFECTIKLNKIIAILLFFLLIVTCKICLLTRLRLFEIIYSTNVSFCNRNLPDVSYILSVS